MGAGMHAGMHVGNARRECTSGARLDTQKKYTEEINWMYDG
jgi:hypothetical protein